MTKQEFLDRFGGSVMEASRQSGIGHSTIAMWPNDGPIPDLSRFRICILLEGAGEKFPARWWPKPAARKANRSGK